MTYIISYISICQTLTVTGKKLNIKKKKTETSGDVPHYEPPHTIYLSIVIMHVARAMGFSFQRATDNSYTISRVTYERSR